MYNNIGYVYLTYNLTYNIFNYSKILYFRESDRAISKIGNKNVSPTIGLTSF